MTNAETSNKVPSVAEQGAHVAPGKVSSKKGATPKKGAQKGHRAAKGGKSKIAKKGAKTSPAKKNGVPRAESKSATILELIGRPKGATLAEIMKATEWQAHSVRGFLSVAAKKHRLKIESAKNEAGDRAYKIAK